MKDVPGFSEAFASHDKPLKDLLNKISESNSRLKEENLQLKDKCTQDAIKVTVTVPPGYNRDWTGVFHVKANDQISTLLDLVKEKRGLPEDLGCEYCLTKVPEFGQHKVMSGSKVSANDICACKENVLFLWQNQRPW